MAPDVYFDEPPARSKRQSKAAWVLLGLVGSALFLGSQLSAPYLIERPGPVFNVLGLEGKTPVISIADAKTYPTDGQLDLLTVNLIGSPEQTPSWLELLGALLDPAQAVVPLDEVFPPNVKTSQVAKQDQLMMEDSQSQATAVALRTLGYQYTYQVYVDSMDKNAAALGKIRAGDQIDTVDGKRVTGIQGLRTLVGASKGASVIVSGRRAGKPFTVTIQPKSVNGNWRLGIFAGTKFKFPINVSLKLSDVGGPSGGMMFALGIYDKLTPGSLTGGQIIAGTGTIEEQGSVGPIGGIQQKMYGAQRAGAKWFLAPAQNCSEVVGHIPAGLKVVRVATFTDALTAVKQIGARQSIFGLPVCGG